jgi:hypothetical protein
LSFALAKAVPTIFDHTHQSTRNYKNTPDQPLESAAVTRKKKKQGVEKACQKGGSFQHQEDQAAKYSR